MGKGRGRPGGNPDFGTKYSFSTEGEPRNKVLGLRFTEKQIEDIKKMYGDRYNEACRELILKSLYTSEAKS